MRRKVIALLLVLFLLPCLNVTALASDCPIIADEAGVLSDSDFNKLTDYARSVSDRHACDVAVAFISSLNGKNVTDYADDYYDYYGFGYDAKDSGILLLVSVGDRQFATTTCGKAVDAFNDNTLRRLEDDYFLPELADSDWEGAAEKFIEGCDAFLTAYENRGQTQSGQNSQSSRGGLGLGAVFCIIISFLLAGIPTGIMKRKLTSVEKQYDASDYTRPGSFVLHRNSDRFLYSHVTKTEKPRNNNSSRPSNHSSTHVSSSGRSHGGSSGRF